MAKWPVYNLTFPTRYQMCATMLRFQEHYESPKFRGKVFTLEEYMDWYASVRDDKFTYFDDWSGFNFPGHILEDFEAFGDRGDVARKESMVVDYFSAEDHDTNFYVVGTVAGSDISDLAHEMVHALYYLHPEYAEAVDRLVRINKKDLVKLVTWLRDPANGSYHPSVVPDEVNAYACTGYPDKVFCWRGQTTRLGEKISRKFCDLFEDHMGFPVDNLEDEKWIRRRIRTVPMRGRLKRIWKAAG